MNPAPQQALEAVGRARDTELAVRIGNKARAALAHERTALAALAAATPAPLTAPSPRRWTSPMSPSAP
ncbi:hypothetical protein AB0B79_37390 [Streptomyces sp. NPDC039022]|uniref:hypothetical protein n=1 Tax=Streptomyces sp. NPDC039022 TaxID=3157091 RepID=UPI00340CCA2D